MQAMDIIAVNNNAVSLMRQGSFQNAIPFFLSALRELHRTTGVQQQNMKMHPIDDDDSSNSSVSSTFVQAVRSIPLGDALSYLKPSIYQDQDAFSIFDRAFLIDSSCDLPSSTIYSSEEQDQHYAAPVLLYNMGLAYQLLGMEDLRSQHSNLKKAMKAYRMAAAIARNDLVSLAVSNNMGHIYSQFCDTQESQRCLDSLRDGLSTIQDSEVEILEDEFSAFQMNVLIMHGQKMVASAAA
jgi:tetratricopeptide (TPR) repeat protein